MGEGGPVQLQGVVPEVSQTWFVELYDDHTYDDRSIVVGYQDRALLELNNFNNLDGSLVQEVPLAQARETTVSHTYVAAQTFSPTISVTADDGDGQTVETARITIGPEVIFDDSFETD